MEVEDKYLQHVADAAGIPQAPQDAESDEEDEPEDLDEALADEGDDSDEDDAEMGCRLERSVEGRNVCIDTDSTVSSVLR